VEGKGEKVPMMLLGPEKVCVSRKSQQRSRNKDNPASACGFRFFEAILGPGFPDYPA
jgi:hypothetical protein